MSFSDLKRKSQANFDFLQKELTKSSTEGGADERLWKPELDASGNGYAVLRFLPAPEGEALPWAKVYSHAFQGPGGWLIDNCLTTNGDKCPVCAHNNGLWNSGVESDKEIARKQKRKLSYYSNIYVVTDPKHPDNEGKVFLYKFGKKIHDKILAAMQPEFQDETPVNVFDFWEGANFKLKIKTVAGYWNYDSAEFDSPSALSADDDELETIYSQQHSLEAFTNASEFKSYDALEDRLNNVLGLRKAAVAAPSFESEEYEPAPVSTAPARQADPVVEDDDALSYFAKLAAED
ncbi:single-stranded DNA binding protein [Cyanophage S-RIM44]|uniref:Single-stranded DNA-binding protein n=2 Tax=Vellamovirus TaxID=2733139 RepID=A0A127KMF3_9CAUD|nr:single strand DNA binding protein [Prochlorococcus phage Syn1]ADO99105.1 ssDNA binding protein [Prochlorococcus phage Syn1]AMO43247.1 single stranded DNA-binding protein [Cyanophage S-RIM44]AOO12420.1 single-stranded DNA binding protein [Cyanophage S-RIM44]AOO12885.1 single-stranded DNA binding protein [Cyanophage S-RIM44]